MHKRMGVERGRYSGGARAVHAWSRMSASLLMSYNSPDKQAKAHLH